MLPEALHSPGSPILQGVATAGAGLLLVPLAFAIAKRSGRAQAGAGWVSLHALSALAGTVLVVIHTAGQWTEPPALLLLALVGLMVLGVWARSRGAVHMANTFGTKPTGFALPRTDLREQLVSILSRKRAVLAQIDPGADEARFSPRAAHWCRHPQLVWRYTTLARNEATLIGNRRSVGFAQAWWRPLHLALAAAFMAGLGLHVIVVTFSRAGSPRVARLPGGISPHGEFRGAAARL